jgi:hypothetical protein
MVVVLVLLASGVVAGCADGNGTTTPRRDAGSPDSGINDGGRGDASDAGVDTGPMVDSGRGDAGECEGCSLDRDCVPGAYCVMLGTGVAGHACLQGCNPDVPSCPPRFECVMGFVPGLTMPVCAPVGERCCVDADGDLYGTGVGCLGNDCDETNTSIHAGATEVCNGIDDNCNGTTDEGDPMMLCPLGTNVATTSCTAGACVISTCTMGFADCDHVASNGCEVNLNDPANCGGCGMACTLPHSTAPICSRGVCVIGMCDPGYGDCDGNVTNGCETSLDSPMHCGTCTTVCALSNATSVCTGGACAVDACDPHWGDCDGRASNGCERSLVTLTDCGTCNSVCSPSGGSGSCATGMCRVSTCAAGYEDCDMNPGNGCETSIRTLTNCGACGVPCSFTNGVGSCAVGACSLVDCNPGFGNCDGASGNGCETSTRTLTSCGACGIPCAPANATGDCSTGTCRIAACSPGFSDCDGNPANGCETALRTLTNCASCGDVCSRAHAVADCSTGTCATMTCAAGYGDCDGVDSNGCETSTRTLTDCGVCGVACARTNATATCASGTCGISSCSAGYSNCNGVDGDGCETDIHTLTNCGGCGIACTRANAVEDCSTGVCTTAACNAGFGNCDGLDANGCEAQLNTMTNCGMCGRACTGLPNASATCSTGACLVGMCVAGYGDCNLMPADGCETRLNTVSNCGACGFVCSLPHANPVCTAGGTCGVGSCQAGWADCDGNPANGCEVNTQTDPNNCLTCGHVCTAMSGTPACVAGACTISSCMPGFRDCNGLPGDGCEVNINTSLANCGGCGVACAPANGSGTCSSGTCSISGCSAGFYDINAMAIDGCECQDTGGAPMCAAATAVNVAAGTSQSRSGTLPATGLSDFFIITAPTSGTVTFNVSAGFVINVRTVCGGMAVADCNQPGDSGSASGVTQYDFFDNCGTPGCYTRNVTWPTSFYVEVARSSPVACDSYTLTASSH